jgi:polyhydroxybutyrate depolymerase
VTLLLVLLVALTLVLVFFAVRRQRQKRPLRGPLPRRPRRPGRKWRRPPSEAEGRLAQLKVGRQRRDYLFYRPAGVGLGAPLPLLMVFHGGFGHPLAFAQRTGLNEIAARHGFAIAYPAAVGHWADGRDTTGRGPADIDFVHALIERLEDSENLDRRRRYALGTSNGGMFVFRLTIEVPQLFAAYSANLASLPESLVSEMAQAPPLPLVMMNAVEDRLTPWRGGIAGGDYGVGGRIIGVEDTLALWRMRNHCGPAQVEPLWRAPDDVAIAAELYSFPYDTPDGAPLRFLKLLQGGHRWPRAPFFKATVADGPLLEVQAGDLIWAFLAGHALGTLPAPRPAATLPGPFSAP